MLEVENKQGTQIKKEQALEATTRDLCIIKITT
jgi:hypothetical protein